MRQGTGTLALAGALAAVWPGQSAAMVVDPASVGGPPFERALALGDASLAWYLKRVGEHVGDLLRRHSLQTDPEKLCPFHLTLCRAVKGWIGCFDD